MPTRTVEQQLQSKLRFSELRLGKSENKVGTLQAELNELKDRFIVAMEKKERPGTNELQAKEIVSLRGRLAKGKAAYQAEKDHSDQLLIERGNYAAEVLSLKIELGELKDVNETALCRCAAKEKMAQKEADKFSLLRHKYQEEIRLNDVSREKMAEKTDTIILQNKKLADLDKKIVSMNETLSKWNDQILEDGEIIKIQRAELSEARSIIKSWVPIVESFAGRKMSKAEKAKWND